MTPHYPNPLYPEPAVEFELNEPEEKKSLVEMLFGKKKVKFNIAPPVGRKPPHLRITRIEEGGFGDAGSEGEDKEQLSAVPSSAETAAAAATTATVPLEAILTNNNHRDKKLTEKDEKMRVRMLKMRLKSTLRGDAPTTDNASVNANASAGASASGADSSKKSRSSINSSTTGMSFFSMLRLRVKKSAAISAKENASRGTTSGGGISSTANRPMKPFDSRVSVGSTSNAIAIAGAGDIASDLKDGNSAAGAGAGAGAGAPIESGNGSSTGGKLPSNSPPDDKGSLHSVVVVSSDTVKHTHEDLLNQGHNILMDKPLTASNKSRTKTKVKAKSHIPAGVFLGRRGSFPVPPGLEDFVGTYKAALSTVHSAQREGVGNGGDGNGDYDHGGGQSIASADRSVVSLGSIDQSTIHPITNNSNNNKHQTDVTATHGLLRRFNIHVSVWIM
jgi:hypothetical protein